MPIPSEPVARAWLRLAHAGGSLEDARLLQAFAARALPDADATWSGILRRLLEALKRDWPELE